jgi:hypothetical protein
MSELSTTETLALRNDIARLKLAMETLTLTMANLPGSIEEKRLISDAANFAALKDDLMKMIDAKPTVRKRAATTSSSSSSSSSTEIKEKPSTALASHPNFPLLTISAWGSGGKSKSVKVYTLQMINHYQEHITSVIPDNILNIVKEIKDVKDGLADKKTDTSHKKARLIAFHLWVYLDSVNRRVEVETLIATDRSHQNNIRTSGTVTSVPTENLTKEEEDAGTVSVHEPDENSSGECDDENKC